MHTETRKERQGGERKGKRGYEEETKESKHQAKGKEEGWEGRGRQNQPGQGDSEPTGQGGEVEGSGGTA